jgi:DNA helicase-2/ATP-dependent DNA helicase PcrA
MIDSDIFGDVDKSKLRQFKPVAGTAPKYVSPEDPKTFGSIRKLKPIASPTKTATSGANLFDGPLSPGTKVMHERFGKGEILSLEGAGGDKKAEINFEVGGIKKLLLRFAKLEILE